MTNNEPLHTIASLRAHLLENDWNDEEITEFIASTDGAPRTEREWHDLIRKFNA